MKIFSYAAVGIFLLIGLVGCTSVPNIDPLLENQPRRPVQISTGQKLLSPEDSRKLLQSSGVDGNELEEIQNQLSAEQMFGNSPIFAGNQTHLLQDGDQSFPAIFTTIRQAKNNINLEYFILEDIEQSGVKLSDLLLKKHRQGVVVNIIYDSFGSDQTPDAFFKKLRDNGINFVSYNPLNPLDAKAVYNPDARDHRKILIVDGTTAITGGVNLSTTYLQGPGKSQPPKPQEGDLPAYWRDTDIQITGPAVAELQKLFLAHWHEQQGPKLAEARYFPKIKPKGPSILHIMGSTPDATVPAYYVTLLSAVRNARARIWLHTAYFVPTEQEEDELQAAAKRGVDVRLILPEKSDSEMGLAYQHASYGELLNAGVKIYEIHGVVLHSKTVTIDGVWSVLGSSNFDHRSVILNDEVDTVVIGHDFANQLEKLFLEDQDKSHLVTVKAWENRSLIERLKEFNANIWGDEL